jgi:hypothetical protein
MARGSSPERRIRQCTSGASMRRDHRGPARPRPADRLDRIPRAAATLLLEALGLWQNATVRAVLCAHTGPPARHDCARVRRRHARSRSPACGNVRARRACVVLYACADRPPARAKLLQDLHQSRPTRNRYNDLRLPRPDVVATSMCTLAFALYYVGRDIHMMVAPADGKLRLRPNHVPSRPRKPLCQPRVPRQGSRSDAFRTAQPERCRSSLALRIQMTGLSACAEVTRSHRLNARRIRFSNHCHIDERDIDEDTFNGCRQHIFNNRQYAPCATG